MLYIVVQENLNQESQTENLWAKKKGNFVIGHVTILEKVKLYQFIHTHHFNLRLFMDFFWFVEGLICEI